MDTICICDMYAIMTKKKYERSVQCKIYCIEFVYRFILLFVFELDIIFDKLKRNESIYTILLFSIYNSYTYIVIYQVVVYLPNIVNVSHLVEYIDNLKIFHEILINLTILYWKR